MRTWRFGWSLVGLVVLFAAGGALWPAPSRATPGDFLRIKTGMTQSQVEVIMGKPTRRYSGRPDWGISNAHLLPPPPYLTFEWNNVEDQFTVTFDRSGKAFEKMHARETLQSWLQLRTRVFMGK